MHLQPILHRGYKRFPAKLSWDLLEVVGSDGHQPLGWAANNRMKRQRVYLSNPTDLSRCHENSSPPLFPV